MALSASENVLPVFIYDTHILEGLKDKDDRRVSFINHSITELLEQLEAVGSSLYVLHETPLNAFRKLTDLFAVEEVFTNHDYEPYAIERDRVVHHFLASRDIPMRTFKDQVIFEKSEVVKKDLSPYTVYTPYSNSWKEQYHQVVSLAYPSETLLDHFVKNINHPFKSPDQFGFKIKEQAWPSKELDEKLIRQYEDYRNLPATEGTSRLGVHLRFGTVSIRQVARYAKQKSAVWLNELLWREFFMQILFHFPRVVTESFKIKFEGIAWRNDEKEFEAWCRGETGYPLVDAGMRQLNETGWMHNRVRMVVASFLVKDLLIDWRWGEAYFAEKLLDYELSSNNGNWQWAAGCGCDAAPYFRIFHPELQQKKFDPDFEYIKKWIPDFKPGYIAPIVEHDYARKRTLEVYKKAVTETT